MLMDWMPDVSFPKELCVAWILGRSKLKQNIHQWGSTMNLRGKTSLPILITIGMMGTCAVGALAAHAISSPASESWTARGYRFLETGVGQQAWTHEDELSRLSEEAHHNGKCAGFMDLTNSRFADQPLWDQPSVAHLLVSGLEIRHEAEVRSVLDHVSAQRMLQDVVFLSTEFRNRYARSAHGVRAAESIANGFRQIAQGRSDVTVELVRHSDFSQPSVHVTIAGSGPLANERVVIGGHIDSILSSGRSEDMRAPGADDNATGTATLLEVFRGLMASNIRFNRTIEFMGYAGEELGLLGSRDIAEKYRAESRVVVGVMQFDMTGFPGRQRKMTFMTDFTNPDLTQFSQRLMDTYVGLPWKTARCGYACSDHASWTRNGYASVMPFETGMSIFSTENGDIHTSRDVVEGKVDSEYMVQYAKLGLAFAIELGLN